MKKLFAVALLGIVLLGSSQTAFAANNVSEMAVTKGGRHIAECAQMMERGISECVTSTGCSMKK